MLELAGILKYFVSSMLVFINNFKYQNINQSARNSEYTILLTKVEIYSIIPIELVGNRKEIINGKFIRYKKFTCSSRR